MSTAADKGYTITDVSEELFQLISSHHADHPDLPLTLTPGQIRELAGCAAESCRPA